MRPHGHDWSESSGCYSSVLSAGIPGIGSSTVPSPLEAPTFIAFGADGCDDAGNVVSGVGSCNATENVRVTPDASRLGMCGAGAGVINPEKRNVTPKFVKKRTGSRIDTVRLF